MQRDPDIDMERSIPMKRRTFNESGPDPWRGSGISRIGARMHSPADCRFDDGDHGCRAIKR